MKTSTFLTLYFSCIFLFCAGMWFSLLRPMKQHFDWMDRVKADIVLLESKRPLEIDPERWAYMVNWTHNLHCNCAAFPKYVVEAWGERFADELERRLAGTITLADIDWIWDEYAANTTQGQRYSDEWRPTKEWPPQ